MVQQHKDEILCSDSSQKKALAPSQVRLPDVEFQTQDSLKPAKFVQTVPLPAALVAESIANPAHVVKWTCGQFSESGGTFNIYSGMISYQIVATMPASDIKMRWKMADWPSYSEVLLRISSSSDSECKITACFDKVSMSTESLEEVWMRYIFTPIKRLNGVF